MMVVMAVAAAARVGQVL
jgi:hypothetical protein